MAEKKDTGKKVSVSVDMVDEAAEYVDSIMSRQRVVRVGTPRESSRKRNRSAPSPVLSTLTKKARNTTASPESPSLDETMSPSLLREPSTRRALYQETPTPAPRRKLVAKKGGRQNHEGVPVEQLIEKLSMDVRTMFSDLNNRIDKLEQGLEQRISSKVAQLLDKRVNSEMKRIRQDVDSHIENVTEAQKAEMAADIAEINKRMSDSSASSVPDLSCNIVIRNLPETNSENTKEKVDRMLSEGCGLNGVKVVSAERKKGPQGKPGAVIAKLRSKTEKQEVMQNKNRMKSKRRYENVYINHDRTRQDRLIEENFRAILSALKNGDHDVSLRGNRVVRNSQTRGSDRSRTERPHQNTYRERNGCGERRDNSRGSSNRGGYRPSRGTRH